MDRVITWAGSLPLTEDMLHTNQNTLIAIGYLIRAAFGPCTTVDGLTCTPTNPPSLNVTVSDGSIIVLDDLEETAYSTLPQDVQHDIMKMGINISPTNFPITPPVTSGYQIVYLIRSQSLPKLTSIRWCYFITMLPIRIFLWLDRQDRVCRRQLPVKTMSLWS